LTSSKLAFAGSPISLGTKKSIFTSLSRNCEWTIAFSVRIEDRLIGGINPKIKSLIKNSKL
jgi:hypothetical protein